jgi:hypothetical protein
MKRNTDLGLRFSLISTPHRCRGRSTSLPSELVSAGFFKVAPQCQSSYNPVKKRVALQQKTLREVSCENCNKGKSVSRPVA